MLTKDFIYLYDGNKYSIDCIDYLDKINGPLAYIFNLLYSKESIETIRNDIDFSIELLKNGLSKLGIDFLYSYKDKGFTLLKEKKIIIYEKSFLSDVLNSLVKIFNNVYSEDDIKVFKDNLKQCIDDIMDCAKVYDLEITYHNPKEVFIFDKVNVLYKNVEFLWPLDGGKRDGCLMQSLQVGFVVKDDESNNIEEIVQLNRDFSKFSSLVEFNNLINNIINIKEVNIIDSNKQNKIELSNNKSWEVNKNYKAKFDTVFVCTIYENRKIQKYEFNRFCFAYDENVNLLFYGFNDRSLKKIIIDKSCYEGKENN